MLVRGCLVFGVLGLVLGVLVLRVLVFGVLVAGLVRGWLECQGAGDDRVPAMSDDDDETPQMRGFGIPIPRELIESIVEDRQVSHMRGHDMRNRVFNLIESLSVEQLSALRYVLSSDEDQAYGSNQYVDGMVVMWMRVRHQVDPDHPFEPTFPEVAPPGGTPG